MLKRYCGRRSGNIYEQTASLKQLRSVAEYVEEYERVAAQLSSMPEDQQLGYFINGLRPEIKRRVQIHNPEDLYRAMQLAVDVEEEMVEEQGGSFVNRPSHLTFVSVYKGGWSVGATRSGKFRRGVRSGSSYTPSPSPTRAQSGSFDKGSSTTGNMKLSWPPQSDNYKSLARSFSDSSSWLVQQLPYAEFQKRKKEG